MTAYFIEHTIEEMRELMQGDDLADEKARLAYSYTSESRLVTAILEEYQKATKEDQERRAKNGERAEPNPASA